MSNTAEWSECGVPKNDKIQRGKVAIMKSGRAKGALMESTPISKIITA